MCSVAGTGKLALLQRVRMAGDYYTVVFTPARHCPSTLETTVLCLEAGSANPGVGALA